nr:ABC transporter substrate binding protein [uncultured Desulfobacter sp.]
MLKDRWIEIWGGHLFLTVDRFAFSAMFMICIMSYPIMSDVCQAKENGKKSHILYINSYHPGYCWSDDIESGLTEQLKFKTKDSELSIEYLDSKHFAGRDVQAKIADLLNIKYANYIFDLVIVSDNAAFDFAVEYRKRLFQGVPIVFCGYNGFRPEALKNLSNITGVNEETDIKGLIDTALCIQPQIRTLAFILSTKDISSKKITEKTEELIIQEYSNKYKIILLKDAPIVQIKKTLTQIPNESALFLIGLSSDICAGRTLTPLSHGRLISAASPIPIYTFWNFYLNTGVLGGKIIRGYDQGKAAADMALQILNGKSAERIPILMKSPTRYIFDYTAMKRFKIAIDALPNNSIVMNRPDCFYETNKQIVWTAIIAFTGLVAFMIVLTFNIIRRKHVEIELQHQRDNLEKTVKEKTAALMASNKALTDSEGRFRSLSDASFEGILITSDAIIIDLNKPLEKMFGYTSKEAAGRKVIDFIVPDERQKIQNKIVSDDEKPFETLGLKKDGTTIPIEVHGKIASYKNQKARVTAIRDLTEQRRAEKEIKKLQGLLPICASCKKIRDDKGYWNQIEAFVQEHSDASFSHGICPECSDKLYGNDEWYIEMKKKKAKK